MNERREKVCLNIVILICVWHSPGLFGEWLKQPTTKMKRGQYNYLVWDKWYRYLLVDLCGHHAHPNTIVDATTTLIYPVCWSVHVTKPFQVDRKATQSLYFLPPQSRTLHRLVPFFPVTFVSFCSCSPLGSDNILNYTH